MAIDDQFKRLPVILVAAHPDDETIGAGGVLPGMRNPFVVHVTDGAPRNPADARAAGFATREEYARARRQELLTALKMAGVAPDRTCALNVPDQEASFNMAFAAMRLAALFRDIKPAIVLTHSYEGGHPDHDAAAFAVHAACVRLTNPPEIYEFTSYHARAARSNGADQVAMETGCFLDGDVGEAVALSEPARQYKLRMLACFASQTAMLQNFIVDVERFRQAPPYNFGDAPHQGKLFYENFSWGVTGEMWRRLAKEAAHALGSSSVL